MTVVAFARDGAALRGFVHGDGRPLLYQHGLGGSETQVAETVPDLPGFRRLTLECRGQGGSVPGARRPFSIGLFADDALAFCNVQGALRFVAGGTSMGAAMALRLAVRQPDRVAALILARPAWLFDRAPATMRPYAEVAELLRRHDAEEGRALFAASETGRRFAREAPDNLASLLGFFSAPDREAMADLLADVAMDGPGVSRAQAAALGMPTLVIGHAEDLVHPLAMAEELAATIPGATLVRIPSKQSERAAHVAAFRAALAEFLTRLPS